MPSKKTYPPEQLLLDSLGAPIESYLLASAVRVEPGRRILDIGCGSGFITLSIAVNHPQARAVSGIDIIHHHLQKGKSLQEQFKALDHPPRLPIAWCHGDIRRPPFRPHSFEVIVCNPPFYAAGSGIASRNFEKRIAHEDGSLSVQELFRSVSMLLKPPGRFYLIYPASRKDEVLHTGVQHHLILIDQTHHSEVRKRSGGVNVLEYTYRV